MDDDHQVRQYEALLRTAITEASPNQIMLDGQLLPRNGKLD